MSNQPQAGDGRPQSVQMTADGRLLNIFSRSVIDRIQGKIGSLKEVPVASICDYEVQGDLDSKRDLVLYVFDHNQSIAEWKKVRKLKAIDTTDLPEQEYKRLMRRVSDMAETNQQLGIRNQSWFYASMAVSLDFG
ncbi:MAG: hypothetical protein HEP71_29590 [Roseivirga sp.]|nr:hypothetical protein [Roseivirga sp.]